MLTRLRQLLASPIDGASLAVFRIAFGLGMVGEAHSFWKWRPEGRWIDWLFGYPPDGWNVSYHGFEWVQPWQPPGMAIHCGVLALGGLCLALGLATRLAAVVVFLAWSYLALIDATLHNNHYYMWSLLSSMLVFIPASGVWSVDAWLGRRWRGETGPPRRDIQFWGVFLLRAQLFCMYVYGAITKLTPDYLFHAQPVRNGMESTGILQGFATWLPDYLAEWCVEQIRRTETVFVIAYSGLIYDLVIGFLLVFRRTRMLGLALTATFHGLNHFVFFDDIGWFPLLAFVSTLIFLEPDWPRVVGAWLRAPRWIAPQWGWLVAGLVVFPPLGAALGWRARRAPVPPGAVLRPLSWGAAFVLTVWIGFQYTWPWRHWLIPGDVNWTCEGERFSWRMKANQRNPGTLRLRISDPDLVGRDENGQIRVDAAWQGPAELYRQVSARDVRWSELPELLVVFQPLAGERVIYNPYAGRADDDPRPLGEALEQATRLWQARYERLPQVLETFPLAQLLETHLDRVREQGATPGLVGILEQALEFARRLADPAFDPAQLGPVSERLQAALAAAAKSREFGGPLRELLRKAHPFALEGALPPGAALLNVDDRRLMTVDRRGYVRVRREAWIDPDTERLVVLADFERTQPTDWAVLPPAMLLEEPPGTLGVQWNQYHDLPEIKCHRISLRPYFIHQYVQRVARVWEERYGRRPRIYVSASLGLNHHPRQAYLDPAVDLAAAPLELWGHNEWIMPRQGE